MGLHFVSSSACTRCRGMGEFIANGLGIIWSTCQVWKREKARNNEWSIWLFKVALFSHFIFKDFIVSFVITLCVSVVYVVVNSKHSTSIRNWLVQIMGELVWDWDRVWLYMVQLQSVKVRKKLEIMKDL